MRKGARLQCLSCKQTLDVTTVQFFPPAPILCKAGCARIFFDLPSLAWLTCFVALPCVFFFFLGGGGGTAHFPPPPPLKRIMVSITAVYPAESVQFTGESIQGESGPIAVSSKFGWLLSGSTNSSCSVQMLDKFLTLIVDHFCGLFPFLFPVTSQNIQSSQTNEGVWSLE